MIPSAVPSAVPFAAWFESGPLRFEVVAEREGTAHAVLRPEDLMLSRSSMPGSARNRFAAVVSRVERLGPISYVHVDAGRSLTAAVTSASADELDLRAGSEVVVTIKATAIHLV